MRMMMIAAIALILATSRFASPAAAQQETWCWAPDVSTRGDCVYTLAQCQEIVRLRRSGVCHRP
jgi:hypothetical protein